MLIVNLSFKEVARGQAEGAGGSIVDFLKYKPFQTQNHKATMHTVRAIQRHSPSLPDLHKNQQ
jgi:hypothetical protein